MTVSRTRLQLPARALLVLWMLLLLVTFVGWGWLAEPLGLTGARAQAGLLGGVLSLITCGAPLLVITPWRDRPASDLPTLWLMVTVVRLLATPMLALLLYFAARPPMDFYVIGLAGAFLCVLFFETPLIALDIRRQLVDMESDKADQVTP